MRRVTLYSRPGCHLCQEVAEDLRLLEAESDIAVVEVDISTDDQLLQRYQHLIPVVDIEDGPLLTPPLALAQLRAALQQSRHQVQ